MNKPVSSSTDLIPINSDAEGKRTVNARELHEFLGSKQQFADWIRNRIEDYGFEENQDFIIFQNSMKKSRRGRPAREYHITLDMAKELSMVERNEKGKQARRYFIECERRLRQETRPDAEKLAGSKLAKKLTFSTIEREFRSAVKLLRTAGANPVNARLVANDMVREKYDVDCLAMAGTREKLEDQLKIEGRDPKDGEAVLKKVFSHPTSWTLEGDTMHLTIAEALKMRDDHPIIRKALEEMGIKKTEKGLFLLPKMIQEMILTKDPVPGIKNVRRYLLSLPGARPKQLRMNGDVKRGVLVPRKGGAA